MRLLTTLLCLAACRAEAVPSPSPPVTPTRDADVEAQALTSDAPTCLRREPAHDDLCKDGAWNGVGDEKRYFTWRFDACKDGLPREPELAKAVGRCVAIGPHTAFNLTNWCCP